MECGDTCNCGNNTYNCCCTDLKTEDHEIYKYLLKLFDDKILAKQYYESIVIKAKFESLVELDSTKHKFLMHLLDDIPLAHLNKILTDLENRNINRLGRINRSFTRSQTLRLLLFYLSSAIYISFCFMLLPFNSLIIYNENNNVTDDDQIRVFHIIEFTIPFCYVTMILLATWRWPTKSPDYSKSRRVIYNKILDIDYYAQWIQLCSMILECMTSLIALLLILVAQEDFETVAHYLEYSTFLLLTLVDLLILSISKSTLWKRLFTLMLIIISICVIIAMIVMKYYNYEFKVHYLEFSMEIFLTITTMITVSVSN